MTKRAAVFLFVFFVFHNPCQAQEPKGKLIFSVEVTDSGTVVRRDGMPIGKTGIFYYFEEAKPGEYGPLITGYRFGDGQIADVVGGGSFTSENIMKTLIDLPITSFDVAAEMESTTEILRQTAQRQGELYSLPSVRDGAKFKITYDFNDVKITYEAWNPGPAIDELARHNTNIANLKQLIDLFALDYGKSKFGL